MKTTLSISHASFSNKTEAKQPESVASTLDAPPPKTVALPPRKAEKARPAWASKGLLRDDTTLRTSAEDARGSEIGSYQELRDDNVCRPGLGIGPERGEFLRSAYRYLAHRWVNDRSAAMDQIGTELYADMRRAELRAIGGAGYLAQQYGLLTAKDFTPEQNQTGLRITNEHSPEYQRSNFNEEFTLQCQKIYLPRRTEGHPLDQVQFVNSLHAVDRLKERMRAPDSIIGAKYLRHTLVAVEFKTLDDSLHAEKALKLLGLRPSLYEVMKKAHPAPGLFTTPDPKFHNDTALSDLMLAGEKVAAALASLPDKHAMQATGRCAASLLMGLGKALEPKLAASQFKHDPLVANALNALANTVKTLPTMVGDSPRFFAGYAAMLEEMHLLLAATKPYSEDDFKTAAKTMLETRAGKSLDELHIATPKTYLFSSGMDAISMGVRTAKALNRTMRVMELATQRKLPDYFETLDLRTVGNPMDRKDVRMAPLNLSMPEKEGDFDTQNNWDSQKLVQEAKVWLAKRRTRAGQPAVLVLDTTVEKHGPNGTSDLAGVLAGLKEEINNGALKIFLCKSYQKYTAMGSAKIMAGAVTLIAKDDDKTQAAAEQLQEAEDDLGWMQNDESQLLTHFITHAHGSELEMIGNAARNAAFVSEVCFSGHPNAGHRFLLNREEGLPIIATTGGFQTVNVKGKSNAPDTLALQLLMPQLSTRGSFAFLPTSVLVLLSSEINRMRITVGQETREELVEKFYGFGWLNHTRPEVITPAKMLEQAQAVCDKVDVFALAEASLRVLKRHTRPEDETSAMTLRECETLFKELTDARTKAGDAQQATRIEKEFREKLKSGLEACAKHAQNTSLLSEQLEIIGSAFAPHLPDAVRMRTDVDTMHAAMMRPRDAAADAPIDDQQRPFASNMVASLLKIAGIAFDPQNIADEDRADLETFYRAALNAGLPGVSPSARSQIVRDWSRLPVQALAKAVDEQARQDAVDELLRHIHLAPYREDKAKILASISDPVFAALTQPQQRKLIDSLFAPLDAYSRIGFIKNLSDKGAMNKAGACFDKFDADLKSVMQEGQEMIRPEHLSGASLAGDIPAPMSADEAAHIRQQLLQMMQSLAGTLPEAT